MGKLSLLQFLCLKQVVRRFRFCEINRSVFCCVALHCELVENAILPRYCHTTPQNHYRDGINSVVKYPPLNWSVGCSVHGHRVNRRNVPWARALRCLKAVVLWPRNVKTNTLLRLLSDLGANQCVLSSIPRLLTGWNDFSYSRHVIPSVFWVLIFMPARPRAVASLSTRSRRYSVEASKTKSWVKSKWLSTSFVFPQRCPDPFMTTYSIDTNASFAAGMQ